ncbi:hypothetical protein [Streptomyces sp. NPDC050145]|uniref:hypothetical protein n=1 Tax=Streptomyces sp. NPDC050145 TaxID=3365602 RepID=UPI00378DCE31
MPDQILGRGRTTTAEAFWYVLGCLWFGANYFAKVPVKRALGEYGLAEPTGAEKFWYVVMNIALGAGYFAKVIAKKALSETRFDAPTAQLMLASSRQASQIANGPAGRVDQWPREAGSGPSARPPEERAS